MTLTFYDGLGDTAYCNYCPLLPPSLLPFTPTPPLALSLSLPDIKNPSIILDAPPCRLPFR